MEHAARHLFQHESPWAQGMMLDLWREAAQRPYPAEAAVLALGFYKRMRGLLGSLVQEIPHPALMTPVVRAMARMFFPPELAPQLAAIPSDPTRAGLRKALQPYLRSHPEEAGTLVRALGSSLS